MFPFIPIQMSNLQIKEEKVKPETNGESQVTTIYMCASALYSQLQCGKQLSLAPVADVGTRSESQ